MDENEYNRFWRGSFQNAANLNQLGHSDEANNEGWQIYNYPNQPMPTINQQQAYQQWYMPSANPAFASSNNLSPGDIPVRYSPAHVEDPSFRPTGNSSEGVGNNLPQIQIDPGNTNDLSDEQFWQRVMYPYDQGSPYGSMEGSSNHLGAATNSQLSDVGTMSAFDSPGHNQAQWDTLGVEPGQGLNADFWDSQSLYPSSASNDYELSEAALSDGYGGSSQGEAVSNDETGGSINDSIVGKYKSHKQRGRAPKSLDSLMAQWHAVKTERDNLESQLATLKANDLLQGAFVSKVSKKASDHLSGDPNPKNRKDITCYISSAIYQTKRLREQIARQTGETPSSNVGVGGFAGRVYTEYSTMLRDTKRKTAYLEELMKQSGHDDPFVSFARTGYKPYNWKADSVALSTMRDRIGKMKTINSSLDKDIELQETRQRTQNTSDRSLQYQGDSARDRLQSHHDNLLAHVADRETSSRTLRSADMNI
ncbi:hypothetical protein V866_005636 [Kwoniella sp. B9012]